MGRKARAGAVGIPHHVTQRGSGRQAVFFSGADRGVYLDTFFDYAERYGLRVWGYCLMTNHVHFVVVPERGESLARVFGRTHSDYARFANLKQRRCGHFWQARFYSCALDEAHAWHSLAYVERNPVRAAMVVAAEEYPWSSAKAHCTLHDPTGRLDLGEWSRAFTAERWRNVLCTSIEQEEIEERIREATRAGAPLGTAQFLDQLGQALGRDLRPRPPGRPRAKEPAEGASLQTV